MLQALAGPAGGGLETGAVVLGLAIAIILHEVAHGFAALYLGDATAKYAGRLTLNPVKHVDLWGTILVPLFLLLTQSGFVFGWAKPVPVDYRNLRGGKWGPVLVALAGPATNFVILAVSASLVRLAPAGTALPLLLATVALINGVLMLFNLLPIPPLDGSKILYLFLERRPDIIQALERYGLVILLAVLLLLPGFLSGFVFGPAFNLVNFFMGGLII
ncbi:MAG: site-2 protease family protein [Candidatus Andersenbacteria bacterium CG10_big_fil_rev_8_21_14_0_10_54_11]|uniref:Site-2 protease family protein n=1 Tax=Candidatus Andersenbacteria bacterium CG10_big_fil_rev_8_21_14_0_10_54_11 TaxID=1974485 RepID=A0A2M6WYV6_9BACT|nr:MAG: site-2 protease family protein [Candidatus Andersenbacteria bacterium CG10_big_fil_rev_8_21_14_0_10_54_11]